MEAIPLLPYIVARDAIRGDGKEDEVVTVLVNEHLMTKDEAERVYTLVRRRA